MLVEPVQGEAGVIVPPANFLPELRRLCTERNVLFIADEIQSGLGRTGKLFAHEWSGITPDIILMDIMLAGAMDGIEAAKQVRAELGIAAASKNKEAAYLLCQWAVSRGQGTRLIQAGGGVPFRSSIVDDPEVAKGVKTKEWLQSVIDSSKISKLGLPVIIPVAEYRDIVGAARDRTVVLDWKLGRGVPVEPEANSQLMYYAYAAAHTEPTSKFFDRDKPIELFIVSPRVNDGEPFTRWMTSWLQLEAFAIDLKHAVERALEPDAPFKLGPHCRFCNGKVGCPLYNNLATDMLALTREELAEQIAERLPYADLMIEMGKNLKDTAHALLEQGQSIPGWKLVNGRATRSWKDEEKTLKYFAKLGLPAAERHVKKIISPAQAEAALKRNALPAELPAALVDKSSSGTTLAPESDKRPAVAIAPEAFKLLAERLSAS